jgi:PBP1b-binding outer membrane lipoprotein LpoB
MACIYPKQTSSWQRVVANVSLEMRIQISAILMVAMVLAGCGGDEHRGYDVAAQEPARPAVGQNRRHV